ncbi:NtaA/DmoA family FMN-dependent monooxygenase [Herbiconiux moechotypicola]|uniref:LLM class flavin-dependent oxidoreductase n=1 Tax=Herbiconiux moechotypicola TaxID=637393 RepID=A0ABN3DE59_9MICO|nr:NtaA/DmoA family FMN-dependent monooxygenase [Herbiconiux moechotypicola]MCS5729270.1 NtaA/DmoA family FMN-dependent monooxygenase [Herbiconiux moechotypicola]
MKEISVGLFEGFLLSNGTPAWWHEDSKLDSWLELDHWVSLAKLADEAGFDFLFLADTLGHAERDGDMPREVAEHSIQFPILDPITLVTAMAAATRDLGFVVTASTTAELPYTLARRFATLDHLTKGRIAWNIVTGAQHGVVSKLYGASPIRHDQRYEMADEFVELCARHWETVWDDDAVVADRARKVYAERDRLHPVDFAGEHFSSAGYLSVPPSPQRTPYLFQAGASARGRKTAGRVAEGVFIQATTPEATREVVASIREQARREGRDPNSVKIVSGCTVITAPSRAEAVARHERLLDEYLSIDAGLHFLALTGVDLLSLDPARPIGDYTSELGQTMIDRYRVGDTTMAVGEIIEQYRRKGVRGFELIGTPEQVVDDLAEWVEATDIDGIMLEPTYGGSDIYREFAERVMPLLVERGLKAPRAESLTLRERLGGAASRLPDDHPLSRLRLSS